MEKLTIQKQNSGLVHAWLMATMGSSKTAHRQTLKRDLNDISIPKVCSEVSSIAAEAQHLRLTSNLLYGLSLIFKHKVSHMATDLSLVCDRITAPLFTKRVFSHSFNENHKSSPANVKLISIPDSESFEIELDFFPEYHDSDDEQTVLSRSIQNALAIRVQDKKNYDGEDSSLIPAYLAADAKDKSFMDFMDRTGCTKEILLDECLSVDFEFNQHGDIVGLEEATDLISRADFLRDLNLDEDLAAISGSFGDTSKSGNFTNNEQIKFDQPMPTLVEAEPVKQHKRRQLIPIYDEVLTISPISMPSEATSKAKQVSRSMAAIIHEMSLTQPPYLNMCYKMLFGPTSTAGTSVANLPLSARHPTISKLDSFLHELDEIEQGRNVPSRRPSLSLVDDVITINLHVGPGQTDGRDTLDFDIEPLSPMLEDIEDGGLDVSKDSARRLENFQEFLEERARQIAEHKQQTFESSIFTLESLIPSRASVEETLCSRSIAANAVSCLLQLACSGSILFLGNAITEFRPSKPEEISISFI